MERKTSGDKIFALCLFFCPFAWLASVCMRATPDTMNKKNTTKKRSKILYAQ